MFKNKIKSPKIHKKDENIKRENEHAEKHKYIRKMIVLGKINLLTKMILLKMIIMIFYFVDVFWKEIFKKLLRIHRNYKHSEKLGLSHDYVEEDNK